MTITTSITQPNLHACAQRKHRQVKKTKDAPSKTIAFITGNSGLNGIIETELLMLPSFDWLQFLAALDLGLPEWPFLRERRKVELDYDNLYEGCMGVVPPAMLVNLLRDLKDDPKKTHSLQWSHISRKGYEARDGKGSYYMFH
jgi:hypothetical protein